MLLWPYLPRPYLVGEMTLRLWWVSTPSSSFCFLLSIIYGTLTGRSVVSPTRILATKKKPISIKFSFQSGRMVHHFGEFTFKGWRRRDLLISRQRSSLERKRAKSNAMASLHVALSLLFTIGPSYTEETFSIKLILSREFIRELSHRRDGRLGNWISMGIDRSHRPVSRIHRDIFE